MLEVEDWSWMATVGVDVQSRHMISVWALDVYADVEAAALLKAFSAEA